jgi:hypothetical protein
VIIKPGQLFCIHWRGKGLELSIESVLERFPFRLGRIGFLQLFTNQRWIQTAGAKFPLNSGTTLCFVMKTGLDEGFGKLSIVKISGVLQPLNDPVDGCDVSA